MTQQWDKESRDALIAYRRKTQRFPHGVETQNFASPHTGQPKAIVFTKS